MICKFGRFFAPYLTYFLSLLIQISALGPNSSIGRTRDMYAKRLLLLFPFLSIRIVKCSALYAFFTV